MTVKIYRQSILVGNWICADKNSSRQQTHLLEQSQMHCSPCSNTSVT